MQYVYDGTFEGFLTAAAELFKNGSAGLDSVCKKEDILPLLPFVEVVSSESITERFGKYLSKNFGREMPETVYRAFLSEISGIQASIINYIQFARKMHRDPIDMLNVDYIKQIFEACRRTTYDSHRYKGLLRFRSLSSDSKEILFSEFEPQTNCLSLIGDHFSKRLSNIPFLIADRRRGICMVHLSGSDWTIEKADPDFFNRISSNNFYENLWRLYFKCLGIPERNNPELQRSNMPKKYWGYLVEEPGKFRK